MGHVGECCLLGQQGIHHEAVGTRGGSVVALFNHGCRVSASQDGLVTWARRVFAMRWVRVVALCAAFVGLALIALWPWPIEMWSRAGGGDAAVATWDYWWVAESALHGANPWWTGFLFAPFGTYLVAHGLLIVPGLVAAPVTLLFGAVVAYNISVPLWLAFAGLGGYALCRDLSVTRAAAFLGGVMYGLGPLLTFRATGHLGLVAGFALFPFLLLLARRAAWRPSWAKSVGLGVLAAVLVYTDQLSAAYILPALAAYLIVVGIRRRAWASPRAWVHLGVAALVFCVLIAPQVLMGGRTGDEDYSVPSSTVVASSFTYSADVVDFVLPSPASRYLAPITRSAQGGWDLVGHAVDGPVGPGLLCLLLAVLGVAVGWRRSRTRWLLAWAALSWILAIGPVLRLAGNTFSPASIVMDGFSLSALLPFTWFMDIPIVGTLRVPQRFALLALLPAVLLAVIGAEWLFGRLRPLSRGFLLAAAIGLVIVEGAVLLPAGLTATHDAITAPIRADRSNSVVVDVPLTWQSGVSLVGPILAASPAMLRATQHEHPIAAGYISRVNQGRIAQLAAQPLYSQLLRVQGQAHLGSVSAREVQQARSNARHLGVRWAVVWPEAGAAAIPYLLRVGFRRVVSSDGSTLMRLPAPSPASLGK